MFIRLKLSVIISVLIALAIVSISARLLFAHKSSEVKSPTPSAVASALSTSTPDNVISPTIAHQASDSKKRNIDGVVPIKLSEIGFEPSEINLPKARVLFAIHNRTGLREMVLRFDRVGGGRLHGARVPREKRGWYQEVDLTPGEYILTESSHPDWVCRITVASR
jgi:hypothetical protein